MMQFSPYVLPLGIALLPLPLGNQAISITRPEGVAIDAQVAAVVDAEGYQDFLGAAIVLRDRVVAEFDAVLKGQ